MRALYIKAYGGPEVMQIGELPDPQLKRGEVLVFPFAEAAQAYAALEAGGTVGKLIIRIA